MVERAFARAGAVTSISAAGALARAVSDGTGLALVDEAVFELWRDAGMRLHGSSAIVVSNGDEVEVTGPGRAPGCRRAAA